MSLVRILLLTNVVMPLTGRLSSASTYLHLGCFLDDASNRDLDGPEATMGGNLTAEDCVGGCRISGYAYCGLQGASNKCFCGKSYGSQGSSNECDTRCGQLSCGGFAQNDIYYTPDVSESTDVRRSLVYVSISQTFDRARMDCVSRDGDLPSINDMDDVNQTIAVVRNTGTSQTKVWIGMRRSDQTQAFDWVDPRSPKYGSKDSSLFLWKLEEVQSDCVLLDVASVAMETAPCNVPFSYVCRSLPRKEVTYVPVGSDGGHSAIALYIVLPLFLVCYGGSCLIYCCYKIHRNCRPKIRHSMAFPVPKDLEGQRDKGCHRLLGSSPAHFVKADVNVKSSRPTGDMTFASGQGRLDDGPLLPPPPGFFDEKTKRVGARTSQLNNDPRPGGLPFRGQAGQGQVGVLVPGGAADEEGRMDEKVDVEMISKETRAVTMDERSGSRMELIDSDEEGDKTFESKA